MASISDRIERRRQQLVDGDLEERVSRLAAVDDFVALIAERERHNIARTLRAVAGDPAYSINRYLTPEQIEHVAVEVAGSSSGVLLTATPELRRVRFTFDDGHRFDGFTDDTYWNGFLNVKVTEATRAAIVAHLRAQAAELGANEEDVVGDIDSLPVVDGLVDLGWAYTTVEVNN